MIVSYDPTDPVPAPGELHPGSAEWIQDRAASRGGGRLVYTSKPFTTRDIAAGTVPLYAAGAPIRLPAMWY